MPADHISRECGRNSSAVEPSPQPGVTRPLTLNSFNPATVTHYKLDSATGDLFVHFTSGEAIRYVGDRAGFIFGCLREMHWHTMNKENLRALDSLAVAVQDEEVPPFPHIRRCRECGCTENDCVHCFKRTGKACTCWSEPNLCSACAEVKP